MSAPRKEEGAVLLTTLLVVSLMASLAVAILALAQDSARRAVVTEASAQARHYLDGAEAYAVSYLTEQLAEADPRALNLLLLDTQEVTFPVDGGILTLTLSDATNCFAPADALAGGAERLLRLFQYRGVPQFEAQPLVARIKDWQDDDQGLSPGGAEDGTYLGLSRPYRTAGSPMTSLSELRAVQDLTPEIYAAIAPYMCIREADGPLNVNTLRPEDAPLLAAQMGTDPGTALSLIASRPIEGWSDLKPFGVGDEEPIQGGVQGGDPEIEPAVEVDSTFDVDLGPAEPGESDATPDYVLEPQAIDIAIRVEYRGLARFGRVQVDVTGPPAVLRRQRGEAAIPLPRPRPDSLGGGFGEFDAQ